MFLPSKDNDRDVFNVPRAQHTGTRSYGLLRVSELKSQSMVMTRPKPCRYLSLGLGAAIFPFYFVSPMFVFPQHPHISLLNEMLLCFFHSSMPLVVGAHLCANHTSALTLH